MLEKQSDHWCARAEERIAALWADVAALPVHRSEKALSLFLNGLCEILDASSASWLAMKKPSATPRKVTPEDHQVMVDALGGWVPMAAVYTNQQHNLKSVLGRWLSCVRHEGVDAMTRAIVTERGSTRTYIREDVATAEEWQNHWVTQEFLTHYDVGDRMITMFNLGEDAEASILLDRALGDAEFNVREKRILHLASSGIASIHKRLFLENGLLECSAPLSKRERETYRYLLTELSESQIAEQMMLSIHTVHDYARGLYKKFGVKGRIGLMALVLDA